METGNNENKRGKSYDREILVSKVAIMRIKNKSTQTILDFLMNKIGMSRKIAYEILGDAQKYIMEQTSKDTERALAESINRLEGLIEDGDNKLKLEAQKELNKLLGLYQATKIDVTTGGDKLTDIKINIIRPEENKEDKGGTDN